VNASESATDRTKKEVRRRHPSGILYLMGDESVPLILDALLDLPPGREFNKTELAEHAGVTRQTVGRYVGRLVEVNVVEPVPNTTPQRYQLADSAVVDELFALNSALNAASE
jgi:predicted AAA+ superfamily ATPase